MTSPAMKINTTFISIFLVASLLFAELAISANPNADFESIMDAHWQARLEQSPTFATNFGVRDFDHLLSNPSLEAYEKSVAKARTFLDQLLAIDINGLSEANRLNHSLLVLELQNQLEASSYGGKYLIMNNRSGPHLTCLLYTSPSPRD